MQIQKQLPHFQDETALIIVSGTESFKLLRAHNGEIEEVTQFKSKDDIAYDEERTLSHRSGKGQVYGIHTSDKQNEIQEDLKQESLDHIEERLDHIGKHETVDKVFILAPSHVFAQVKEAVPYPLTHKLAYGIKGNYIEHHPFDILELIRDEPKDKTEHFDEQ